MSDFKAKICANRLLVGALPQAPLGELTALTRQTHSWILGSKGGEGRGRGVARILHWGGHGS